MKGLLPGCPNRRLARCLAFVALASAEGNMDTPCLVCNMCQQAQLQLMITCETAFTRPLGLSPGPRIMEGFYTPHARSRNSTHTEKMGWGKVSPSTFR